MSHIAILGTLDTKQDEVFFMKELIRGRGHVPTLVDVGPLGPPLCDPDVSNEKVARAAGWGLQELIQSPGRDRIMQAMGECRPRSSV